MRNAAALLTCLALFLASSGCGSDDKTLVVVNIDGDFGPAERLHVSAKVGGYRAEQDVAVSRRFAVWLPEGALGQLTLSVSALLEDRCSNASGDAIAVVGTTRSLDLFVSLVARPSLYCPVEIEKSGPGSILVRSDGFLDFCESTSILTTLCTTFLPKQSVASLLSVPDPLGYFVGWSGACQDLGQCNLVVSGLQKVSAKFASNILTVAVQSGEGLVTSPAGEISCGQQCTAALPSGTRITLTATPQNPNETVQWSGACSGSALTCEVILDAPTTVGVRFLPYGITIRRLGGMKGGTVTSDLPGIDCGATCSAAYAKGTVVTLTATPIEGYFTGWPSRCTVAGNTCKLTVDDAITLTAPFVVQNPCTTSGTCWHNPLPQGNALYRVWASPNTGVWASGAAGTLLRWDSNQGGFTVLKAPTDQTFFGVWAASPTDVWTVGGNGEIWHFDGSTFSPSPSGVTTAFNAIWGSGPSDIWAVGILGVVLHYDGTSWTPVPSGVGAALFAIWGNGPSDIWAVGSGGAAIHWNGKQWLGSSATSVDLNDVWGTSAIDVWAVGSGGVMQHFDGNKWTATQVGNQSWIGIWGSSAQDLFLVGNSMVMRRRNGGAWTNANVPSGAALIRIRGLDANNVWIVGVDGRLLLWDGAAWVAGSIDNQLVGPLYGTTASDVNTLDNQQRMWHWDGVRWSKLGTSLPPPTGTQAQVPRVYEYSPTFRIFSYNYGSSFQLFTWDGTTVTTLPPQAASNGFGANVWAASPSDIWVMTGGGEVYRFAGTSWSLVGTRANLSRIGVGTGIWGTSPMDVWVIGEGTFGGSVAYRYNGTTWTNTSTGLSLPQNPTALVPVAADDFWVTSGSTYVAHWTGSWKVMSLPGTPNNYFQAGIVRSATDVWFGGQNGLLARWDGTTFSQSQSGTSLGLTRMLAAGPTQLWLGGSQILYSVSK